LSKLALGLGSLYGIGPRFASNSLPYESRNCAPPPSTAKN
jgi:hypothetical protein